MDWSTIGPAFLAGGIFGTIITVISNVSSVFITNKLTREREIEKWLLSERHKASIEILEILSLNPKDDELKNWTYQLRSSSLKLQLLYHSGDAPEPLRTTLEEVFRFVQRKKDGCESDRWSADFKVFVKKLRRELAQSLSV